MGRGIRGEHGETAYRRPAASSGVAGVMRPAPSEEVVEVVSSGSVLGRDSLMVKSMGGTLDMERGIKIDDLLPSWPNEGQGEEQYSKSVRAVPGAPHSAHYTFRPGLGV